MTPCGCHVTEHEKQTAPEIVRCPLHREAERMRDFIRRVVYADTGDWSRAQMRQHARAILTATEEEDPLHLAVAAERGRETAEAALAAARQAERRLICSYCGLIQTAETSDGKVPLAVAHMLSCPDRPEIALMDENAALRAALELARARLDTVYGWYRDPNPEDTKEFLAFLDVALAQSAGGASRREGT